MKKRFIVLIDFSTYSANLLKYAYAWSKETGAQLVLVHQTIVLAPALADNASRAAIADRIQRDALRNLKQLTADHLPPDAQVQNLVSDTPLAFTLDELLAEPFDQLIFAGLKGTGILKQIFMGSVTLQVIEKTNQIVVAMPKDISGFAHDKVFIAVSCKHPVNTSALHRLLGFMNPQHTRLTFFSIAEPDESTADIEKQLSELSATFSKKWQTATCIYQTDRAQADLRQVIHNKEEEILVVQKGSRYLTDQLFRTFFINELVYEGHVPLIVLP